MYIGNINEEYWFIYSILIESLKFSCFGLIFEIYLQVCMYLIFKIYLLVLLFTRGNLFLLGMSVWGCKESQGKGAMYHLPYRWCKDLLNNGDSFVVPSHTQGNPYYFLWRNRCVNNTNAFGWWRWNQKIGCFFRGQIP